jgi:preprotein translocase subunit YajC
MADTTTSTAVVGTAELPPVSQGKMFADTALFLVLMFAIFYFVLIRPQQKKFKDHQSMIKALEKGDKVVVAGGIIGTIAKFEGDDVVVVEVAENTRIKVARAAVNEALKDAPAAALKPAKAANDK